MKPKTFNKQLSTPASDAEELAKVEVIDLDELCASVIDSSEQRRRSRAAHRRSAGPQPSELPLLDALLDGHWRIEVRWRYILALAPPLSPLLSLLTCGERKK
eukprot:1530429-Pleurochrysis_carterae.AAC.1